MYANTVYGALRGLESFSQLVDGVTSMPGARVVPAVKVADAPRFGYVRACGLPPSHPPSCRIPPPAFLPRL